MAKRNIDIKQRGSQTKVIKSVYLIVTEGKNQTETIYLSHFQEQGKEYRIAFVKAGSSTDAESLYKALLNRWKEEGLSVKKGDKGFVVMDIDNDKKKAEKTKKLIAMNKNSAIDFIVSNPTFEVWFLLHFKDTARAFPNGKSVIRELRKFIPNYQKNVDCYDICKSKLENAIENASKNEKRFEGEEWPSVECNPRTDMKRLIGILK